MEHPTTLEVPAGILAQIRIHGEETYPEEGVGLLLGTVDGSQRRVVDVLILPNVRESSTRHNRYLISPEGTLRVEEEAERRGLEVIGVFHSHPDHPCRPSEFDLDWALPWFSYIITSVQRGRAAESRCWRLADDHFEEVRIVVLDELPSESRKQRVTDDDIPVAGA